MSNKAPMTSSPQHPLHELRCHTCDHFYVNPNDDWFCKLTGEELAGEIEVTVHQIYGCASHSDAPRPSPAPTAAKSLVSIHRITDAEKAAIVAATRKEERAATIAELLANAGEKCPDYCIYKRFASNWKNGEAHDAATRKKTLKEVMGLLESAKKNIEFFHIAEWHPSDRMDEITDLIEKVGILMSTTKETPR